MIRNLKLLGLAIAAMMAFGGLSAVGASAANFHADAEKVVLTGESNTTPATDIGTDHVFDAAGSTITCQQATFKGTSVGTQNGSTWTTQDITMTAEYHDCTVSILGFKIGAAVDMGNCAYTFFADGHVSVVDRSGVNCDSDKITYRVSNFLGECDVEVGESGNQNLTGVTYDGTSTVTNGDILVTPNVTGIDGTATGGLCPEAGAFTNGQYTMGTTTVKGFVDTGAAGSYQHGAQTPIWVTH